MILWHIRSPFYKCSFPQRQFANILYVKYADVVLMMGINCLDCGLLNVRINLCFTSSYEGANLKVTRIHNTCPECRSNLTL